MTLLEPGCRETLTSALDTVVERTQDFTDSAYTSHEHRENILLLCDRAKLELNTLLRIGNSMVSENSQFISPRKVYVVLRGRAGIKCNLRRVIIVLYRKFQALTLLPLWSTEDSQSYNVISKIVRLLSDHQN